MFLWSNPPFLGYIEIVALMLQYSSDMSANWFEGFLSHNPVLKIQFFIGLSFIFVLIIKTYSVSRVGNLVLFSGIFP